MAEKIYMQKHLQKLLVHHEGIVTALKTTIAVLGNGDQRASRPNGILEAALAVDEERVAKRSHKRTKKGKERGWQTRERREGTARLLAQFSTTDKRPLSVVSLGDRKRNPVGNLQRHGYVRRAGSLPTGESLWLRTSKEFKADTRIGRPVK
jgi:hypothetical protein